MTVPVLIVVGAEGSGKTLIIKALQCWNEKGGQFPAGEMPTHRPTIGAGLTRFRFGKKELDLRELGGQMRPIWADYYSEAVGVMFVVDSASPLGVCESAIILEDTLRHPTLAHVPFLLLFSKTDIQGMWWEELDEEAGDGMTSLETSAYTARNAPLILAWLSQRL